MRDAMGVQPVVVWTLALLLVVWHLHCPRFHHLCHTMCMCTTNKLSLRNPDFLCVAIMRAAFACIMRSHLFMQHPTPEKGFGIETDFCHAMFEMGVAETQECIILIIIIFLFHFSRIFSITVWLYWKIYQNGHWTHCVPKFWYGKGILWEYFEWWFLHSYNF